MTKGSLGVPYQGSKNSIAQWVVENLPSAKCFIDLFAGGCAVTHAAILSGKYNYFLANDITNAPRYFQQAIAGEFDDIDCVLSKDEFAQCDDDFLKILNSFGNKRASYLWGANIEPVKVAAGHMLSRPSMYERRLAYKKFINELQTYIENGGQIAGSRVLKDMQSLESLNRVQLIHELNCGDNLIISNLDYRAVGIPDDSVVYADPPYKATCIEGYQGFNYDQFEEWLSIVPFPVIVSEYTCPDDCVVVATREKNNILSATVNDRKVVEKLCVQERFLDEYHEMMNKQPVQHTLFDELETVVD